MDHGPHPKSFSEPLRRRPSARSSSEQRLVRRTASSTVDVPISSPITRRRHAEPHPTVGARTERLDQRQATAAESDHRSRVVSSASEIAATAAYCRRVLRKGSGYVRPGHPGATSHGSTHDTHQAMSRALSGLSEHPRQPGKGDPSGPARPAKPREGAVVLRASVRRTGSHAAGPPRARPEHQPQRTYWPA